MKKFEHNQNSESRCTKEFAGGVQKEDDFIEQTGG